MWECVSVRLSCVRGGDNAGVVARAPQKNKPSEMWETGVNSSIGSFRSRKRKKNEEILKNKIYFNDGKRQALK